jgi:hypothetical protein
MALPPLLTVIGIGVLVIGALTFWTAVQNWLADVITNAQEDYGLPAEGLYSALVVIDRVMVNGQRVVIATGRAVFQLSGTEYITREEKRVLQLEELPDDVRAKLEGGQTVSYELSIQHLRANPTDETSTSNVTYKLAVRRSE